MALWALLRRLAYIGIVFVVLAGLSVIVVGRENAMELIFGAPVLDRIDFASLKKGPKPNQYLVCPEGWCAGEADRTAPVFALSPTALRDRWMAMIATQPRTQLARSEDQELRYDFIQRSALLRFPDIITVQFMAVPGGASLAIYSRAQIGHSDLGVNRKRITAWLEAL